MAENIRLAFRGILSHKLRSFLTMLGVIIGIASIIAIVSTIQGTNQQIMENLIGAGNNCVTVRLNQGDGIYWMEGGAPQGVSPMTEDMIAEIRNLPDVDDASFYVSRTYVDGIMNGNNRLEGGKLYGVDDRYLSTTGYEVCQGRHFVEADYRSCHKVLLLDEIAATALFPEENPVGGTVEIQGDPFTVVGVIRRSDAFQPVINSIEDYYTYSQDESGTLLMPDALWPVRFRYDEPQDCVARASRTEDMSRVGREVQEIMNRAITSPDGQFSYKAEDLLEKAREKQELSASTNNLLIWVASIALLVGGIGVMNIMLVSVTERTAEIGLKKALGARKRRILIQFLTESAVLTSIGGVIGVIAGIVLAQVISRVTETPAAISVPVSILSVAFSMVIGIVFGIIPSMKAANLNPIEALRHE